MPKEIWEEHESVFHYTNKAGLEGVLKSQALHATHYKYLNDTSEMVQLKPRLEELIRPSIEKTILELLKNGVRAEQIVNKLGGLKPAAQSEAKTVADVLYRISFGGNGRGRYFQPYVASFCSHRGDYEAKNGLLSQWRVYAAGDGFAIVFDTKALLEFLRRDADEFAYNTFQFGDVINDGDAEGFAREFSELIEHIQRVYPEIFYRQEPDLRPLFGQFVSAASRFKHRGFSEECEVRVVLSPISEQWFDELKSTGDESFFKIASKKIKSTQFKAGMTPFIVVGEAENFRLPIRSIIIGPGLYGPLKKEALERFIEIKRLDIEVRLSETPLS